MKHLVTLCILLAMGVVLGVGHVFSLDFKTSRVVCGWLLAALFSCCALTYWVYAYRAVALMICGILIWIGSWVAFDHWALTDPEPRWYSRILLRYLLLPVVAGCCAVVGNWWDNVGKNDAQKWREKLTPKVPPRIDAKN